MTDLTNKTVEELRDMFFWSGLQEDEPVMAPFDELARRLAAAEAERDELVLVADALASEIFAARRGVGVTYPDGHDPLEKFERIKNVAKT